MPSNSLVRDAMVAHTLPASAGLASRLKPIDFVQGKAWQFGVPLMLLASAHTLRASTGASVTTGASGVEMMRCACTVPADTAPSRKQKATRKIDRMMVGVPLERGC